MEHGGHIDKELQAAFKAFCAFGDRGNQGLMTGAQFSKLTRDCGIQGKLVSSTEVDITFARVKHGARKIQYRQFVAALEHLALRRFPNKAPESAYSKTKTLVLNAHGPHTTHATVPDTTGAYGRFTDESKYTGAYLQQHKSAPRLKGHHDHDHGLANARVAKAEAREVEARGAFSKYDRNGNNRIEESELKQLLEDMGFHVDDVHAEYTAACGEFDDVDFDGFVEYYNRLVARKNGRARRARAKERGRRASHGSAHSSGGKRQEHKEAVPHEDSLEAVFTEFCAYGGHHDGSGTHYMDGAHWVKFCKDVKLVHAKSKFTTTDADLAFSAVKQRGQRNIDFREFELALGMVAKKLYPKATPAHALVSVVDTVVAAGGPKSHGTKVVNSGITRKLTNPSLYTGSSRARFDAEGHGVGMGSRKSSVEDLADITRPNLRHHANLPAGMH